MKISNIPSTRFLSLGIVGALITLAMSTAYGTLLFSDSFAYPAGPLSGDGPPAGSPPGQTAWTLSIGSPQVVAPGLRFRGVSFTGNTTSIAGITGANGDVAIAGLSPVNSGVVWIGFLIKQARGQVNPSGFSVLAIGGAGGGPSFGMLFDQNLYGIDNNTGQVGSQAATTTAPSRAVVWLVAKLDFNAGTESLFVNPTIGSQPDAQLPMEATFQANGFNEVVLATGYDTATFSFDEVRIGTTLNDVRR